MTAHLPAISKSNLQGIFFMLAAMGTLSLMDAGMKELSAHYPPIQVACLRGSVSLPFIVAWIAYRYRSFVTLIRVRWTWHLVRGVLAVTMLTSFIYAISKTPLSETYTLFFIAPSLITALSVPLLGEKVDLRRWIAIVLGFGGVLIALHPGAVGIGIGALAALVGATCYALNAIMMRVLGRTDSTAAMTFWFTMFLAIGAGAIALPGWVPVQSLDAKWLVLVGVCGAAGQFFLTEAFSRGQASVVAPFEYSSLFWGVILDLIIWQKLPGPMVFVGASVIVACGIYLTHRARRVQPVTPP